MHEYTELRKKGATNMGVETYIIDINDPRMWAIVMINAGLDHACSNHECLEGILPGHPLNLPLSP